MTKPMQLLGLEGLISHMVNAAVVAIGTELTTGDLVDTNSAWLSAQLVDHGIETVVHLNVGDEEADILSAFSFCHQRAELLFVTGGLGPTADDLTRDCLSKWFKRELLFNEDSWQRVQSKLTDRGTPILPRHRLQCWFPKDSEILTNSSGTADAFSLTDADRQIWVLPGPPSELKTIWSDHISAQLRDRGSFHILRWRVFGAPESEIAERIEPLMNHENFRFGFRASFPYVEVKLICDKNSPSDTEAMEKKIDNVLAEFAVVKGEPPNEQFEKFTEHIPSLHILDEATNGKLLQEWSKPLSSFAKKGKPVSYQSGQGTPQGLTIHIGSPQQSFFPISLTLQESKHQVSAPLPHWWKTNSRKTSRFIAESTMIETVKWLKTLVGRT